MILVRFTQTPPGGGFGRQLRRRGCMRKGAALQDGFDHSPLTSLRSMGAVPFAVCKPVAQDGPRMDKSNLVRQAMTEGKTEAPNRGFGSALLGCPARYRERCSGIYLVGLIASSQFNFSTTAESIYKICPVCRILRGYAAIDRLSSESASICLQSHIALIGDAIDCNLSGKYRRNKCAIRITYDLKVNRSGFMVINLKATKIGLMVPSKCRSGHKTENANSRKYLHS
ncbi:hypothetical protein CP157_03823 (plasmid) [Paracoccus marcusii]|nr:hypothetical protein CP157_03823 [Paracoccus marcusii]